MYIKGALHDSESYKWMDKYVIILLAANKIKDSIESLQKSKIEIDAVNERLSLVCSKFIKKLKFIEMTNGDSRNKRLAQAVAAISQWMVDHKDEEKFLRAFIGG